MRYEHEVSLKWLEARQGYLTASDVCKMMTDINKLRQGKTTIGRCRSFAKVLGSKLNTFPDTQSPSSAAARGHFMEPYAVEEWESVRQEGMLHWDDFLLASDETLLAFSPDALDVPQPMGVSRVVDDDGRFVDDLSRLVRPTALLEVKCYDDGAHYQRKLDATAGVLPDERWQVAVAMAVCPCIERGTVVWYAPQCRDWFDTAFEREDLEEEIATVLDASVWWKRFLKHMETSPHHRTEMDEAQLRSIYLTEMMLNGG